MPSLKAIAKTHDAAPLDARTLPLPRILWIELTSRCPFDCIFCTRASLRGAGEHLDFALYQRLIGELDRPQIVRLNYAGESGHYPKLAEAVTLAVATGAQVELVSALASLKPERLQAALDAGLTRLTVSLHTLDAQRFVEIYRFGALATMHERLQQVLDWRARANRPFTLDIAFVAMQRNLDELPAVAAFAAKHGMGVLAVHPLIRRDPLPVSAAPEHDAAGTLDPEFRAALASAIAAARRAAPDVAVQLSSHELQPGARLAAHAQAWPWPLPAGAAIAGCDQSPFDSVHILADGRVIACEVTEKLALGDLRQASLAEIWHGPAYRQFRERHVRGVATQCQDCVYKSAYLPGAAQSRIGAIQAPPAQLLRGWHGDDGDAARWSGATAALWLPRSRWRRRLRLRGLLAAQRNCTEAGFEVRIDGVSVHRQLGAAAATVDLMLPIPASARAQLVIELLCGAATSPHTLGIGADVRELGFALLEAQTLW